MRSSRLLVFSFLATSFLVCCSSSGHAEFREGSKAGADSTNDMPVPGGLPVIAKLTGFDPDSLKTPFATERVFRYLLDAGPPVPGMIQRNPARRRLLAFLSSYGQFLQYLRKEDLIPANWGNPGVLSSPEISFPLSGDGANAEKTRKLLAYFGLNSHPGAENNPLPPERQDLLNALGINVQDGSREAQLTLRTGRLALVPQAQVWDKIVPAGAKSQSLFERFLENPAAMRLYVGLAGCDPSIRESALTAMNSAELRRNADLFYLFGPRLKAENAGISFPGSNQSWESILGLQDRGISVSLRALLKDNGVALLLYYSLASAPPAVRAQITDSPDRLKSYYDVLKAYGDGIPGTSAIAVAQDTPRILRQLAADSSGLHFALEDRVARALVMHVAPERLEESPGGHIMFTPEILARLLPHPKASPYIQASFGNVVELLHYLQDTRPGLLTDRSLSLLLDNPRQAPIFLDLIGDIAPSPPVFSKYLEYCKTLSSNGFRGWNINRTRTSQSIFFLISALAHENALTRDKAGDLLGEALQSFQREDEGAFAQSVADFLSMKLLPEISGRVRKAQDPLLSALSGSRQMSPDGDDVYEKNGISLDRSDDRLQRMRETVQSQSYTPLDSMLEIYGTLRRLKPVAGSPARDEDLRLLSQQLNEIKPAGRTPGGLVEATESISQPQPSRLKQVIEKMRSGRALPVDADTRMKDLAAQLHAELSVSLLAYCYAYSEASGLDVLTYDPNFIRKHQFYAPGMLGKARWALARFQQDDDVGGYIEGSLTGLGFELGRLQVAQATRTFSDEQETYLASTILLSSRRIPYELRTDRSQEYVALATHLGSELIRRAGSDEALHSWLRERLDSLIAPQRMQEFETTVKTGDAGIARGMLTRSELFLLGEAYFKSPERPASNSLMMSAVEPTLNKLNSILPDHGSEDYQHFQQEIEQYGILLRSRTGLSQFSFEMIDPYETLENDLRPQYLYDRLCDLKIRLAELNYALGLPAVWGEFESEFAMRVILPRTSQPYTNIWRHAEETINMLSEGDVRGWIEEIRNRGISAASNGLP